MYTFKGKWFDGKSSQQIEVTCYVDASGITKLYTQHDRHCIYSGDFSELTVSSRLGNTPRYVYFPEGEKFETLDNDTVDICCQHLKPNPVQVWVHRLETHWHYVLLTLAVVVAFSWAVVVYGVPATAKAVAAVLPEQVNEFAGSQTLEMLDKTFMEPSNLDEAIKQRVEDRFAPVLAAHPELKLQVLFRDGGAIGANAFALPDGTMIFTDQMIELSESDEELVAVLAHEIGHVKYHHGMRLAIQDSLLAFLVVAITGDVSTTSELLLALPVILTQMSYSRDFERESDDYALAYMQANDIDPMHFVNLMTRLEASIFCREAETEAEQPEQASENASSENQVVLRERETTDDSCEEKLDEKRKQEKQILDYFSSHPATAERLQQFRHAH